eukprot:gene11796-20660_t
MWDSPRETERFYLRLLLLHVRGARSWDDLLIVGGVRCPDYRTACIHRGLLGDDSEFIGALNEARDFATAP